MKKISLTQGKVALVDDSDFERVNQHKWYVRYGANGRWIAMTTINKEKVLMHRFILKLQFGDGKETDHRNRNSLDNQKHNLRLCNRNQNNANSIKRKNTSSKYKGVYWSKIAKKWQAYIGVNGKNIYLGLFKNELEAAATYDLAALKRFGEFARTNFELTMMGEIA